MRRFCRSREPAIFAPEMRSRTLWISLNGNKIAGAVLGTLLFIVAVKIGSDFLFLVEPPAKPGYVVQGVPAESESNTAAAPGGRSLCRISAPCCPRRMLRRARISPHAVSSVTISPKAARTRLVRICGASLIVRAPRVRASAIRAPCRRSMHRGPMRTCFKFWKSPQALMTGTKMTFAGLPSAQDRIDLLAYMRTLSDLPAPIPPPAPGVVQCEGACRQHRASNCTGEFAHRKKSTPSRQARPQPNRYTSARQAGIVVRLRDDPSRAEHGQQKGYLHAEARSRRKRIARLSAHKSS